MSLKTVSLCLLLIWGFAEAQNDASMNHKLLTGKSKPLIDVSGLQSDFKLEKLLTGVEQHFRGVAAVGENTVWASGTGGTVLRSTNAGEEWEVSRIEGCDSIDFRDIHAFNNDTALVLAAGKPALIYRTENAGKDWKLVYRNDQPGIFMDGFDFFDEERGMAYGDPIDGQFMVISSADGGFSWQQVSTDVLPAPLTNEAGFAASGTGIKCLPGGFVRIATGNGAKARILASDDYGLSWRVEDTEVISASGCGIFSIDFWDRDFGLAVGGSYERPEERLNVSAIQSSKNEWETIEDGPRGYHSVVQLIDKRTAICSGRTGIDLFVRSDAGGSWTSLSTEAYYTLSVGKNYIFFLGKDGKFARVALPAN